MKRLLQICVSLVVFIYIALPAYAFDEITVQVTGSGAMSYSLAPGYKSTVIDFRLHLGSAATTSQYFTVTVNAGAGATYDVLLYTKDLSTIDGDIVFVAEEGGFRLDPTDTLDFAYTNTDVVTYGLQMRYRRHN